MISKQSLDSRGIFENYNEYKNKSKFIYMVVQDKKIFRQFYL